MDPTRTSAVFLVTITASCERALPFAGGRVADAAPVLILLRESTRSKTRRLAVITFGNFRGRVSVHLLAKAFLLVAILISFAFTFAAERFATIALFTFRTYKQTPRIITAGFSTILANSRAAGVRSARSATLRRLAMRAF